MFSGDGSKIFFDSTGPPQGIYEVPALGGEPRLIAANGRSPNVSPDGKSLAYSGFPSGRVMVVSASGGEPRDITSGFSVLATAKVWLPDSKRITFYGQREGKPETQETWVASINGGAPEQLTWGHWVAEHGYIGTPNAWPPGDFIYVTVSRGMSENYQVYRAHVAHNGFQILGGLEPITFGGASSRDASIAAGVMAFDSGAAEPGLWSLPAETNQGRVTGVLEKLSRDKAMYEYASSSPDGKTLVFRSNRAGNKEIYVRDMASGEEHAVVIDSADKTFALIDNQRTEVLFSDPVGSASNRPDIYVVPMRGGSKRKLCDDCLPLSLSPDGTDLLARQLEGGRSHVDSIDVASGRSAPILQHTKYPIATARRSPDGKWVGLLLTTGAASADVMIAPFRGATPVQEQDWIRATPDSANISQVFWSPDGLLVYYVQTVGGSSAIMARRLERGSHPAGAPFRVYEFAGRVRPVPPSPTHIPDMLNAIPGRFIGVLTEQNYNIWMMDLPR